MFRLILLPLLLSYASMSYATIASDNAMNYLGGWTDLSNNGTGFNPWGFTMDVDDTVEIADSTDGAGDINTSILTPFGDVNESFRLATDNGGDLDVFRSFGGGASLGAGDIFSFDLSVNYRNGNKGFDLRNAGTGLFNFNVGSDNYFFGGIDLGLEGWAYVSDGVYSLEFGFITETIMNAKITRTSDSDITRSFEIPNVALSGSIDNFKFYVSGTDDDSANNSLYFNNLAVIPEPSVYGLILGALALAARVSRR
ncbi:MAG: hypothetical protein VXU48_00220 [Verrucomicrobiota bacterium]|nr:hypothetical protein [Verrucomicrobiota bacterium]